jgi:hypothetical protein
VIEIVEFQEFVVPVLSHRLSGSTYRRGPDIRLLLVIPEEGLVVDGVVGHIEFLVCPPVGPLWTEDVEGGRGAEGGDGSFMRGSEDMVRLEARPWGLEGGSHQVIKSSSQALST